MSWDDADISDPYWFLALAITSSSDTMPPDESSYIYMEDLDSVIWTDDEIVWVNLTNDPLPVYYSIYGDVSFCNPEAQS
jgi:hypothetical protein